MESIWTTHENPLISNSFFVRKMRKGKIQDDTSQRKRKIARTCKILSKFSKSTRRSTWKLRGPQSRVSFHEQSRSIFRAKNPRYLFIAHWMFHHAMMRQSMIQRCLDLVSGIPIGRSWSWNIGQLSKFSSEIVDRSVRLHRYRSIVNVTSMSKLRLYETSSRCRKELSSRLRISSTKRKDRYEKTNMRGEKEEERERKRVITLKDLLDL